MRYSSSQKIHIGDVVKTLSGETGIVVCSMDSDEYSDEYKKDDWEYLKFGAMIIFKDSGLMHYQDGNDIVLISRKNTKF